MPVVVRGRPGNGGGDDSDNDAAALPLPPRKQGMSAEEEAAASSGPLDDPRPMYDILGADGEYPLLPQGHQWAHQLVTDTGKDPLKDCLFGGARHTKTSDEWKRLVISDTEREWKSCISANFRVVGNHEPNTCRHLYHSGPHVSMVFDVTQQISPESGDKTIKTICFLTQQVNSSADLRGCIVGTHYTSLDINHSKGKAVRGIFWHGGHKGGHKPKQGVSNILVIPSKHAKCQPEPLVFTQIICVRFVKRESPTSSCGGS
jgi:hypothetical protein